MISNLCRGLRRETPDQLAQAIRDLQAQRMIDGNIVANVAVAAGSRTVVRHGLERRLTGYVVIRRSADVRVWDESATDERLELWLQSSGTATLTLWVF
jgi:hypothetical protein